MEEKEVILTQEGFDKLENELEKLRTETRTEIAERIKVALGFGDLSENSEYDEAKNAQAENEAKIAELESKIRHAKIIDESEIDTKTVQIGNTVTLPMDISNIEQLEEVVVALTEQVTYRLRKEDLLATVVNVQLRTKNFEDFSHQSKLNCATSSTKEILKNAKDLLKEMYKEGMFIRLVGVRVDGLVEEEQLQLSLFGNTEENKKQQKLDSVLDGLNEKYGYNFVKRAGKMNVDKKIFDNFRKKF